jgi:hypothetical protein
MNWKENKLLIGEVIVGEIDGGKCTVFIYADKPKMIPSIRSVEIAEESERVAWVERTVSMSIKFLNGIEVVAAKNMSTNVYNR